MQITPIKTPTVSVKDDLYSVLGHLPPLQENMVVAISSKIISLCQGDVIPKSSISKDDLIAQHADAVLKTAQPHPLGLTLTIAHGVLLPTAGIDESNSNNSYIVYPHNLEAITLKIWQHLRKTHKVQNLGIVVTDSRSTPLRRGVTGVALDWCGFKALKDYRGQPDIHGTPLESTQVNVLDSLASAAVLIMGEGNEKTPLATINGINHLQFQDRPPSQKERAEFKVSIQDDIYAPLINSPDWFFKKKP